MAITSAEFLSQSMAKPHLPIKISKVTVASQLAGGYSHYWRTLNIPGVGAIPTNAEVLTSATQPTSAALPRPFTTGKNAYISRLEMYASAVGDVQLHDRLAQMGGLSGIVTTAQTVDVSVTDSSLDVRRGAADYSDVLWWIDWYAATGATVVNCTVTFTDQDNNTGQTLIVPWTATMAVGRALLINPYLPQNQRIKSIESVTLSASTANAGSFGITASRLICTASSISISQMHHFDWAKLGLPRIFPNSVIELRSANAGTSAPAVQALIYYIED